MTNPVAGASPVLPWWWLPTIGSAIAAWIFAPLAMGTGAFHSDLALHMGILVQMDQSVAAGGSVVDFPFDASPFGMPLLRLYQHLPHLLVYGLHRLCLRALDLETCLRLVVAGAAAGIPWAVWSGLRRAGHPDEHAGWAALVSVLVVEKGGYGLGLHAYGWGAGGLFTQELALLAMVPAAGAAIAVLDGRGGWWAATAWGALALGSHPVIGLGLGMLVAVVAVLRGPRAWPAACGVGALWLMAHAHQWVPQWLDRALVHASPWEEQVKLLGPGPAWVAAALADGDLWDDGRGPWLTALVVLGCGAATLGEYRFLRPWALLLATLGVVLAYPPVDMGGAAAAFHWHRLVAPMGMAGVVLAGTGAGWLRQVLHRGGAGPAGAMALVAILVAAAAAERVAAHVPGRVVEQQGYAAQAADNDVHDALGWLSAEPRGRVHPGMRQTWVERTLLGPVLQLHNVTTSQGLPTLGMLYHAMHPATDVAFAFDPASEATHRWLGISQHLAPLEFPGAPFLASGPTWGRLRAWRYPRETAMDVVRVGMEVRARGMARVELLTAYLRSPLALAGVAATEHPQPGIDAFPVVDAVEDLARSTATGAVGVVLDVTDRGPSRFVGRVRCAKDEHVLARTGFHPGWRARVDGVEAPIEELSPGFPAVRCAAGDHEVTFEYHPGAERWTGAALAVAAMVAAFVLDRRIRRGAA